MRVSKWLPALSFGILFLAATTLHAAGLTFALNSTSGTGSAASRPPSANPPCTAPSCILFSGTLTDTDTDSSFLFLESIEIAFPGANPATALLSLDNTFSAVVPGLLSGDPNFATDNSGNPPNAYTGPIFGIDLAPGMPAGTYTATVTIHASGGTGDPDRNGVVATKSITITIGAGSPIAQVITFGPLDTKTLGAAPFPLSASASSNLPVAFASNTAAACTISGATLTLRTAGTCSVTATQPGNTGYAAAAPVTQSFTINPAAGGGGGGGGGGAGGGGGNPLTVSPATITINATANGSPATQTVTLSYQTFTQGAPAFSSNFNTNQGQGWLSASPASGTMTQASFVNLLYTYTATVTISANPAGIVAGSTYTGTVNFSAAGGIASESVTMNVIAAPVPQPTAGIANAASAGQAPPSVVAPGSYIAIYGTGLAGAGNPSATTLPLPFTLNGAQATLCGSPLPLLYASSTQINALVPQSLKAGTSCPFIVTNGSLQSAPVPLNVTALQPGIYTRDTSGSGPGIVTNAVTGVLNDAAHPAHASDFLVVYATGLGPVLGTNNEPAPADGAATPTSTLFRTTSTVTATIGGIPAPVSFAGLTPTFAGLNQVNIQVPAGVIPGSAVNLILTATDPKIGTAAVSNQVTIAVQ